MTYGFVQHITVEESTSIQWVNIVINITAEMSKHTYQTDLITLSLPKSRQQIFHLQIFKKGLVQAKTILRISKTRADFQKKV